MKKKLFKILLIFTFLTSSCGFDKEKDNPGIVSIGQTVTLKEHDEEIAKVTYNSCDDEEVEDASKVMIIENITIKPLKEFKFNKYDFYLRVNFLSDFNDDDIYYLDKNVNTLKNGYYFFDNVINGEVNYSFCYIVPKEKNGIMYNGTDLSMRVFSSYIFSYSFYSKYYTKNNIKN